MRDETRDINVSVNIYSVALKAFFPNKVNSKEIYWILK